MGAVDLFNHPVVATLLLTLAFLGLVIEVRSEGFRRAGWAGLLALVFFSASHLVAGSPSWTLLLVLVGVLALWPALEDPGRRATAAAGFVFVAAGAYAMMVGAGPAPLGYARAAAVLLASGLLVVLAVTLVWWRLPASERPGRGTGVFFFLPRTASDGEELRRSHVGERGRAVSPLRPGGWALVGAERLQVVAEGEWLEEGDALEVVGEEGLRARVRRAEERKGADAREGTAFDAGP